MYIYLFLFFSKIIIFLFILYSIKNIIQWNETDPPTLYISLANRQNLLSNSHSDKELMQSIKIFLLKIFLLIIIIIIHVKVTIQKNMLSIPHLHHVRIKQWSILYILKLGVTSTCSLHQMRNVSNKNMWEHLRVLVLGDRSHEGNAIHLDQW